ncbi:hypothetical protein PLESTM_000578500 [Pleodorina starrii]|nr:hypothetical protein PLESTM_000578500 [Pleodorina starrii]
MTRGSVIKLFGRAGPSAAILLAVAFAPFLHLPSPCASAPSAAAAPSVLLGAHTPSNIPAAAGAGGIDSASGAQAHGALADYADYADDDIGDVMNGPNISGAENTSTAGDCSAVAGGPTGATDLLAGGCDGNGGGGGSGGNASCTGYQTGPPWLGVNLGNLPIFPFGAARLQQSEVEVRQLLLGVVDELADAGGNLLRVWLHIDGALNPCWGPNSSTGGGDGGSGGSGPEVVVGCGGAAVEDLKWLLRQCHRRGVKVLLTLWSHDVLAVRRDNPPQNRDRALHMIRTAAGTAAYVDNCLTPLVRHLANTRIPPPSYDDDDALAASDAALAEGLSDGGTVAATAAGGSAAAEPPPPAPTAEPQATAPGTTATAPAEAESEAGLAASSLARPPSYSALLPPVVAAAAATASTMRQGQLSAAAKPPAAGFPTGRRLARRRTLSIPSTTPVAPPADRAQPQPQPQPQPPPQPPPQPQPQHQENLRSSTTTLSPLVRPVPQAVADVDFEGTAAAAGAVREAAAAAAAAAAAVAAVAAASGAASADLAADGGGATAATYSSVMMGYDLFNEPEGMSWDLRLYRNYMYDMEWGSYTLEDPDYYAARPERAKDYRSLQARALKAFGGKASPVPGRTDVLQYEGWHFVANDSSIAAGGGGRAVGGSGSGSGSACSSRGYFESVSAAAASSSKMYDTASTIIGLKQLDFLTNAVYQYDKYGAQLTSSCPLPTGARVMAAAAAAKSVKPMPWYGNASLAAAWETLAAQVSRTPPPSPGPSSNGTALNQYMYKDVVGHHNSELPYLLPLVTSCRLRTVDVTVPELQRFISRLAAAVHKADPQAKVTVGAHSMPYCTDAQWLKGRIDDFETSPRDLYSDAALRRAFQLRDGSVGPGWDPSGLGTLDFYAPHGYPDWGRDDITRLTSPFYLSVCAFQLDKPALIGEFWTQVSDKEPLTADNWLKLHDTGGYMGGLGWAMLQVVEEPMGDTAGGSGGGSGGDGRQLSAPRRIVDHENRGPFLSLLREMRDRRSGQGAGGGGGGSGSGGSG